MQCNLRINGDCQLRNKSKSFFCIWYKKSLSVYLLLPVSWFFYLVVLTRRWLYQVGIFKSTKFSVPVLIVGNITLGGTGKTPLVIYLAKLLKEKGYSPGIVSRGYGGKANKNPQVVRTESTPDQVGDEPLLIAKHTECPVFICANRVAAVKKMIIEADCNIIISDDGMQHYALDRQIEISVVDSERKFGNGFLLPAGPLREPISRLKKVDFIVINGMSKDLKLAAPVYQMELKPSKIYNLIDPQKTLPLDQVNQPVHAVAGIGNPQRFFETLRSLGLNIIEHVYPDHHQFQLSDFHFNDQFPVVMTEKDSVKCKKFNKENFWYLPVEAKVEIAFINKLLEKCAGESK